MPPFFSAKETNLRGSKNLWHWKSLSVLISRLSVKVLVFQGRFRIQKHLPFSPWDEHVSWRLRQNTTLQLKQKAMSWQPPLASARFRNSQSSTYNLPSSWRVLDRTLGTTLSLSTLTGNWNTFSYRWQLRQW